MTRIRSSYPLTIDVDPVGTERIYTDPIDTIRIDSGRADADPLGSDPLGTDSIRADPIGLQQTRRGDVAADRLNLLFLTDTSVQSAGGSERFLRNLIMRLSPEHYQVTLVQLLATDNGPSMTTPLFDIGHVTRMTLPMGAIYGRRGWLALRKLRSMLREQHYDIVQSHHEKSDLLNALLPRGKGTIRISNRRDLGFNKSPRLRMLFRALNYRFDSVVAPALPIIDSLARDENIDPRRMVWIPNGVDTERFAPPTPAQREECRQALRLEAGHVAFGCVASLTPVKQHTDLIIAFSQVHSKYPHTRLLLVGDGPLRAKVEAQLQSLGLADAVDVLGDRPDVARILHALDALVLCSSTEGMSNAILEAMACGLPVVASEVGGNPQLIQRGISGLLVPAGDSTQLAQACIRLVESPEERRAMGECARRRIESDFSLETMVRSFERLYQRLKAQA